MVCGMAKTRGGAAEERVLLDRAGEAARSASARLRGLVDTDAEAFNAVMAAYRLPKGTEEEKAARKAAIGVAMERATEVPLDTAEQCLRVMEAAGEAYRHGNPNASSDARTGALLALAGLLGGVENVRTNTAEDAPARRRADGLVTKALALARDLGLF
jgi:glutamate formiminotransferase/formiminotetrahydrofolate cyclodeaminase